MSRRRSLRLVRDVIADALGAQDSGYFCRADFNPVFGPEEQQRDGTQLHRDAQLLDLSSMVGEFQYKKAVASLYAHTKGAFTTPSELLAPWYSYGLAHHLVEAAALGQQDASPAIVEFGGGSGANARHVLDWLAAHAPEVYARVRYVNVEVSRPMAERAKRLLDRHGHGHKFRVIQADCRSLDWSRRDVSSDDANLGTVHVIALELLDNLPHDKVRWKKRNEDDDAAGGGAFLWTPVEEAWVDAEETCEVFAPLTDPLARRAADVSLAARGGPGPRPFMSSHTSSSSSSLVPTWLRGFLGGGSFSRVSAERDQYSPGDVVDAFAPTGALAFLSRVVAEFPDHRLFVADFDALPPPNCAAPDPALGAPLVSTPDERDLPSYLDALDGSADIFFPTDFLWLKTAIAHLEAQQQIRRGASETTTSPPSSTTQHNIPPPISVLKPRAFFAESPVAAPCATRSGYNPLLDDFLNTSILIR